MGVVAFDYAAWATRYPELAAYVAQPTAAAYFGEAELYCDNTANSPVTDDSVGGTRSKLLNMLTAHVAALNAPLGSPSSPLVGRISNATQGSVTVATDMQLPAGSAQWYNQTKYGAAFWQASARYRQFRYASKKTVAVDPSTPLFLVQP